MSSNLARGLVHGLLLAFAASMNVDAQTLDTEVIATGLTNPVDLESPPGDERLFIAEQSGTVRVIARGSLLPTPYIDLSGIVEFTSLLGLRGIVFHPDYAANGYFYVWYDEDGPGQADIVLARYTVSASDPNQVDPATALELLRIAQPAARHGGGDMAFGPDGMLYGAMGDGEGEDPDCNAQNPSLLLGKMLRLDVDGATPYAIPADNPFVADPTTRDEIWHLGLRHPWRWSFDRNTGDMYLSDVGQVQREEVNFIPAGTGGLNFGWKVMEGSACNSSSGCSAVAPCDDSSYADPIIDYATGGDCSIIGGFVYRGASIPSLQGHYLYGDFCSGRVWSLTYDGMNVGSAQERTADLGGPFPTLNSFGQDSRGELYLLEWTGTVRRIIGECHVLAYCEATPNSAGGVARIGASGSLSVADADLTLESTGLPPNRFGYYLMSQTPGFVPLFGGSQGNLCIGSPLIRFAANSMQSSPAGELALTLDFDNLPNGAVFMATEDWHFQCWFRDVNPTSTSNTTDAIRVRFCP